jgi:hypothetical protein
MDLIRNLALLIRSLTKAVVSRSKNPVDHLAVVRTDDNIGGDVVVDDHHILAIDDLESHIRINISCIRSENPKSWLGIQLTNLFFGGNDRILRDIEMGGIF